MRNSDLKSADWMRWGHSVATAAESPSGYLKNCVYCGDTATLVKFRVRLEQAGADWIVTDSKMKESARNPLTILDQ